MAYWGITAPLLKYGVGYTSSWNFETRPGKCGFDYDLSPDRAIYRSVINGHVNVVDRAPTAGYVKLKAKLTICNLTTAEMVIFRAIAASTTVKLTLHYTVSSSAAWEVTCVVTGYTPIAERDTRVTYPAYDTVVLELESQDYVEIKTMP